MAPRDVPRTVSRSRVFPACAAAFPERRRLLYRHPASGIRNPGSGMRASGTGDDRGSGIGHRGSRLPCRTGLLILLGRETRPRRRRVPLLRLARSAKGASMPWGSHGRHGDRAPGSGHRGRSGIGDPGSGIRDLELGLGDREPGTAGLFLTRVEKTPSRRRRVRSKPLSPCTKNAGAGLRQRAAA